MADIIQFHVLTAFPPHNVNRDEDGRPKTCLYGGDTRGRISSQAKKRALRFSKYFDNVSRAYRTRKMGLLAYERTRDIVGEVDAIRLSIAINTGLGAGAGACKVKPAKSENEIKFAQRVIARAGEIASGKAKKVDDEDLVDDVADENRNSEALKKLLRSEQGIVVSSVEREQVEKIVEAVGSLNPKSPDYKKSFQSIIDSTRKSILVDADRDIDTALFGRMVAAKPEFNVEAACAVSHAFTTHRFSVEGDYFSAGEELNELGETGAAITSYGFFGGGVYYQHAVLNVSDLRESLGSDERVREACELFLNGLVFAQPKGKRNAFASDTAASYVLATRGEDPAVSLGLAFMEPVPAKGDVTAESIKRLNAFHDTMRSAYGLKNAVIALNAHAPTRTANAPKAPEVWTFEELRAFVVGAPS